ncbi:MAG: hypothetical protein PHT94_01805 [Candidatus Nanoarchaeia archaeon]|nr:hypothetical protein [Candidatus Nanoarchaeia archaeon]
MFNQKIIEKLREVKKNMKRDINDIHAELNDHLISINDNTSELSISAEKINELENRLDIMEQRIDKIETMFEGYIYNPEKFKNILLSLREQEIFLILYTANESLQYKELIKKTGLTFETISKCVESLILKGIPIIKSFLNNDINIYLDNDFKLFQSKHKLVNINKDLISRISYESLENYY